MWQSMVWLWWGCEVVHVELVDFAVMVLKLDSSFRDCFCLE